MISFYSLDLLASLKATLKEKNFIETTEIQSKAIPALLDGKSVVGIAETGSGKTMSYAIPILHKLKLLEDFGAPVSEEGRPRAAVVVPSRELGEQVAKVFKIFTHDTRLRVRSVLGGTGMDVAKRNASGKFEVLLATPGRLGQLMDQKLIDLSDLRILAFDEADQMLDQGFLKDVVRILKASPRERQLALFTATAPDSIQALIKEMFHHAEVIESSGHHKTVSTLTTINRPIKDGKRFPVLKDVLAQKIGGGTLIFANTREQCDKLAEELQDNGYKCALYRGEMDKQERRKNLKAFRDGVVEILISTDLAARGLDVEHIERVINYHLPQELDNYIHRAGRTARAGREGTVINFVTERDRNLVMQLDGVRSPKAKAAKTERGKTSGKSSKLSPRGASKGRAPARGKSASSKPAGKKPTGKSISKSSSKSSVKNKSPKSRFKRA
ncbi:DEAD/DEAH box helicase [bacterium]|nr:DEAD/DEAH box helicase [bacterium]